MKHIQTFESFVNESKLIEESINEGVILSVPTDDDVKT